jgi:hypothetical protein
MFGSDLALMKLELIDAAAAAISDGDLVDAMIHRLVIFSVRALWLTEIPSSPEQHWTLMPLHAVNSTVRPAYQIYGTSSTWGGPNAMSFSRLIYSCLYLRRLALMAMQLAWTELKARETQASTWRYSNPNAPEGDW